MKGRNLKKAEFKVSFVEPQYQQQQQEEEGVQHHKVDIRWNTINQPKRKWIRKDSSPASGEAVDSDSGTINGALSLAEPL